MSKICQELKRPLFEVMEFPESELEWWSIIFSIKQNGVKAPDPEDISVENSKQDFKRLWSK